jgi:hypothetical protein
MKPPTRTSHSAAAAGDAIRPASATAVVPISTVFMFIPRLALVYSSPTRALRATLSAPFILRKYILTDISQTAAGATYCDRMFHFNLQFVLPRLPLHIAGEREALSASLG